MSKKKAKKARRILSTSEVLTALEASEKAKKARREFDAAPVLAVLKKHPDGISTAEILEAVEASGAKVPGKRPADRSWKIIKTLRALPDEVQETKIGKGLKRRSTWKLK